jgi:RNA-directed DNA polymerase
MPKAQIPNLISPQHLAALLGMSLSDIYAKVHTKSYRSFIVKKRGGGFRTIDAPEGSLALIQRRLAAILADAYGSRAAVHGFVRHRGIRTNASAHLSAKQLFECDIKDFFTSIHFGRVRGLFMAKPYNFPKAVATLIARICCHHGVLPQGAPTSPVISNMVCGKLDSELKNLARQHGCCYTRYADDITFSTKRDSFPKSIVDRDNTGAVIPGGVLTALLANAHFAINPLKTRLASAGGRMEVTGIVLGSKGLNLRRSAIRQIRCMLHAWEAKGIELASQEYSTKYDLQKREKVDFAAVVRGKLEHLGHVKGRDNEVYSRLFIRYLKLYPMTKWNSIQISSIGDTPTLLRAVYVLRAENSDGYELLSSAFWLAGVGLVTANHAVRALGGQQFKDITAFKISEAADGIPMKIIAASEHHDLAILAPASSFKPLVELQQSFSPQQGALIQLIGYPHYNPGNPVSMVQGQLIREQVFQNVKQLIVSPTINEGNSGGPIMDIHNHVVGIAVKGAGQGENVAIAVSELAVLPAVV